MPTNIVQSPEEILERLKTIKAAMRGIMLADEYYAWDDVVNPLGRYIYELENGYAAR